MKRFTIILLLVLLVPTIVGANAPSEKSYLFPIAASANGAGGTQWKTELCLFNPWSYEIKIIIGTFLGIDRTPYSKYLMLDGDEIRCFDDIIDALELPTGHSDLLLVFEDEDSEFFANSRIYNTATTGEYGQTVEPAGDNNPFGLMTYGDAAVFTGMKNFGTPGGAGYRTNFGVTNINEDEIEVRIGECDLDTTGDARCTYYDFAVPGYSTRQVPMRRTNLIEGVMLVAVTDTVSVYTSTVNNRSGDAVFQGHRIFHALQLKTSGAMSPNVLPLLDWMQTQPQKDPITFTDLVEGVRVRFAPNPIGVVSGD